MKDISPKLKDLIKKILVIEDHRIDIDTILKHPWMTEKPNNIALKLDFGKMKQFTCFSRVLIYLTLVQNSCCCLYCLSIA